MIYWEQRKTSELFKITRGYVLAANITAADKSGDNPYPVYSSQTKDNGLMGYYKDYLYENAITWTTDGANAGTVNYRGEKFYCTNVCGVLLGDKVTPNQMLAEAINNVAKGHVSYVGNPKLMNNVMAEICIWLPSEDTERKAISTFVYSLDRLITLHQSKSFAHIFKAIDNSTLYWEQRKLGEVCNIITKQTGFDYSSTIKPALFKEKADNTYPFIQNKDFNGTTINMDTDFFIPISVAEKFPNIVLDRPSILISISGRIGNVGFYSCVHKAFIGGAVGICKLKYNDDGKFIIHELESEYGQKYFYSLIKASSHANITVEDIRNMELIFPKKKEEKICISTFFSSFDHLITLHQLEPYKLIFKAIAYRIIDYAKSKPPRCIK